MSLPIETLVLEPTADGLMTLFLEDFGKWFYKRDGAYAEAKITDVDTTLAPTLTVLDVCCGLGYNTAAALAAVTQVTLAARCGCSLWNSIAAARWPLSWPGSQLGR
ncbi:MULTISPECIES: hypothetical protein [Cyanophyceae]|uniref:hypothetical protein n=1 Tax=Cyanophyceae TaxID=3028117 RepID=UPI0018F04279|nr:MULTISPECIES: hypothetical protein [Cyanophyceae]